MATEAIEKLKRELEANKNNQVPGDQIVNYLIAASKLNEELAIAIKREDKTLEDCFNYVYDEVGKKLNRRNGYMKDQEVYDMACSYYMDKKVTMVVTDISAEIKVNEEASEIEKLKEDRYKDISRKNEELNDKDKKIKELEQKIKEIQESNKQEALKDINKEVKKKVKVSKKNTTLEGQMSLF